MLWLLPPLLLIFPAVATAQHLHTFSNGELADAEKINENFQYVLENATGSGGCSAEQDGSSVVITCTNGTSGVLAGAGTVAIIKGSTGETPDVSTIPSGAFYLVDGNGEAIAYYGGNRLEFGGGFFIGIGGESRLKEAAMAYFEDQQRAEVTGRINLYKIWYSSEDCTGPAFYDSSNSDTLVHVAEDEFAVPSSPPVSTAWRSSRNPGSLVAGVYTLPSQDCNAEDIIGTKHPLADYVVPEQLLNPVFPLSVEQRP